MCPHCTTFVRINQNSLYKMILQSLLLFLAALLGGLAVLVIRSPSKTTFQLLLVLSGGYLFAITVLHLLPELFAMSASPKRVGLYILAGFFLQLLLELLTKGVEHGHMDAHTGSPHSVAPLPLLVALCIHAFLDGVVLHSPNSCPLHQHTAGLGGLLIGILLHKIPVSFALTSVLRELMPSKQKIIVYLVLFAVASPVGLWASHHFSHQEGSSPEGLVAFFALATGSLLHIATTIFFEASPDHHLNAAKFLASLAGATLATLFEFLL